MNISFKIQLRRKVLAVIVIWKVENDNIKIRKFAR